MGSSKRIKSRQAHLLRWFTVYFILPEIVVKEIERLLNFFSDTMVSTHVTTYWVMDLFPYEHTNLQFSTSPPKTNLLQW